MGYETIHFFPKVVYAKHKPNYFYVTQVGLHESEVVIYEGSYDACKLVCKELNKNEHNSRKNNRSIIQS